jgi:hypothetical protein
MSFSFYVGAVIIIIVILNGIIKHKAGKNVAITDDTITKDVR